MTRLRKTLPSVLLLACLPCAAAAAESAAPPVTVLRPEKGFIDDAYAVTADNSTLIYVNTDGANWAKLRATGLPASAATPATAPTTSSPPAAPPPAAAPFSVPAGQSLEIIGKLPLSVTKLYLLPEDRVLVVSRDTETGGVFNGHVYNLKSRTEVTIPGGIGPASDITVGDSGSGPLVVAITRPGERSPEYKLQAFSARNLKPVASKTWKLEDGEPRITTALGTAMPLYFLDDYLTLATKHNGTFDKKKDLRQPDFLAFIDTLTGKIKSQRPMASPTPLLDLARLRKDHGESVLLVADETTQSLQLLAALPRGPEGGPTELKTALTWPRPASMYEPASLRSQLVRPDLLLVSAMLDPVNEQAVANKRADPDDYDVCAVELSGSAPGPAQRLLMLHGNKRPLSWMASAQGRLAVLRKHKGFSRGGTEIEIYDLKLPPAPPAPAPMVPTTPPALTPPRSPTQARPR